MGEEFLLKWNDYQSCFSAMMESLCLSEEMFDCTISASSHRKYSAHRMVLSTCSPYFRSLFAGLGPHHYPVIVLDNVEDELVEMLVRYMYTGQVSCSEDKLVPLVQVAKTLGIKGLIDVPTPEDNTTTDRSPKSSPDVNVKSEHIPSLPLPPQNLLPKILNVSTISKDELTSHDEGVDPCASQIEQSQLLRRLTSEMTATPLNCHTQATGAGHHSLTSNPGHSITVFSCEHCGKEFTSKRKHQRHVLNVHFGYNPVQCPFCKKGHRDNYNLKQHVCPVLNMKYGAFEKKEMEDRTKAVQSTLPGLGEPTLKKLLLKAPHQ